ncbi:TrkH family potassium uptake protein [Floccifex sp.]|uniref:TrkH family potassium uptake protein n=1 Tax=Floccifex sp. TaxID=2815810 RepID=UPI003EFDC1E5
MLHKNEMSNIGKMIILESCILFVPLLVIPFFLDEVNQIWKFLLPAILSIGFGFLICHKKKKLSSYRLVVFSWCYGFILAAIPFWLSGNLNPVQALFESVSGFTTTGLSVLNVEKLPHIYLFYRGFLQYVGGLGFVMMMLLFIQEKDAVTLYQAEGHSDKLMPTIGKTVKVIILMYGFFLIVGTLLYSIFGMPIFDSLVHSMCALSTGGFSNRLESIGYYHSLPVEWITIFLMLIGTTNFSLLLLLFRKRFKDFFKSSEIRFLFGIILISVPLMTLFLMQNGNTFGQNSELAFFNAFSALSTTGYSTCMYDQWPETALAIMIILMIIGGGIGSTAGGIKLGRVCKLMKNLIWNIKKKIIPDRMVTLMYYCKGKEKELLDKKQVEEASTYAQTYLIFFIIGSIALTFFSGSTLLEGSFEFASSLGTVGLSIGITNNNTSCICLLIEIIGMILGRLEIFVLIQAIYKDNSFCNTL